MKIKDFLENLNDLYLSDPDKDVEIELCDTKSYTDDGDYENSYYGSDIITHITIKDNKIFYYLWLYNIKEIRKC